MLTRYEHKGTVWIDCERPTVEEIESLVEEFQLGAFVERELLSPSPKPRIDLFPNFIYTVLHFPASRDTRGTLQSREVDLIILKSAVITVHYESVPAIHDFARSFESSLLMKRAVKELHSGHIVFELSSRLYRAVEDELDASEDAVNKIESDIFSRRERELVRPISELTREVLNHKRTIAGQDDVLRELEIAATSLFGSEYKAFVASMSALQFRVSTRAQLLLDVLRALADTNNALLSTRQNEIMKNLTVMASIMLPLSLVSSLFGMNTVDNPIVGSPNDFWIILLILAAVGVVCACYFWIKRWF